MTALIRSLTRLMHNMRRVRLMSLANAMKAGSRTLERPALTRLLADIDAGRVGMIMVDKIDRPTRSLADFAKLIDRMDAAGCSFVSVTQAFNTSSSMGRLTLNVLLPSLK